MAPPPVTGKDSLLAFPSKLKGLVLVVVHTVEIVSDKGFKWLSQLCREKHKKLSRSKIWRVDGCGLNANGFSCCFSHLQVSELNSLKLFSYSPHPMNSMYKFRPHPHLVIANNTISILLRLTHSPSHAHHLVMVLGVNFWLPCLPLTILPRTHIPGWSWDVQVLICDSPVPITG